MMAASGNIVEKRASSRHRVLKQGLLAFDHGGGVDCIVRNLSPNGARIDIVSPVGLPEVFTLVIEADHFRRLSRGVEQRQADPAPGVRPTLVRRGFLTPDRIAGKPPDRPTASDH